MILISEVMCIIGRGRERDRTCENVASLSEVYSNKLRRWGMCKAVIGLATFLIRFVIYLISIKCAGTLS